MLQALPPSIDSAPAAWSSSGGKDSLLALWHAQKVGLRATTMLTMFDESGQFSRSHHVSRALMQLQAESLGLQLLTPNASWQSYEEVFVKALKDLYLTGHRSAIFGDIDLQAHRDWEERVCAQAGLRASLPLWQRDRRELAQESLTLGFRAIVVCTDSRHLGDEFCGRNFDAKFLADLPAGVDPCGENGEFHTFVYDGPLFSRPLGVKVVGLQRYLAPPQFGGTRYCFADLAC